MRNIFIIILILLANQFTHAQLMDKVIFQTTTLKTYDIKVQKAKKVEAQDCKLLIIFKSKEVRTNDKGVGSSSDDDLLYGVNTVTSTDRKKQVFVWECGDQIFELNIPKQTVTVRYKKSTYVCIYTGYFI